MTNKYHSLYLFTYVRWESTLADSVAAVLLRMDLLDPKDSDHDFWLPENKRSFSKHDFENSQFAEDKAESRFADGFKVQEPLRLEKTGKVF